MAPKAEAIEVQMNGLLCASESQVLILLIDQPTDPSSFGDNWSWE